MKMMLVEKIAKNKRRLRLLTIILSSIMTAVFVLFALAAYQENTGDFTINLKYRRYQVGLSLYDNKELQNPTVRLAGDKVMEMGDMTYEDFNDYFPDIDDIDGSHNGVDYFAYTFYISNVDREYLDYSLQMQKLESVKGVDEAVRVLIIEDSMLHGMPGNERIRTRYAKPPVDNPAGTEGYTDQNWESDETVFTKQVTRFAPGDVHKYTVVFYLEGWDPECIEPIKGGMVKFALQFEAH